MRTARSLLALVAVFIAAAVALSLPASAGPVRSYFDLTVIYDASRLPQVNFAFRIEDPYYVAGTGDAYLAKYVNISVSLGPQLTLDGSTPGGTWNSSRMNVLRNYTFYLSANITPSELHASASNSTSPIFASMTITITYTDSDGLFPRAIIRTLSIALNYVPPAPPPVINLLPAALLGIGSAGAIGIGLLVLRRARLNELYLMHDSGMLIRHWSRSQGLIHDSDIMSGMLIVLQEFVRDTWKTHNREDATLEQLRFGPQRVVLARGTRTVLAAVVEGRYLNGLPRKLQNAVQEFENSHAAVLANWNGNVDAFARADDIARRFLGNRAWPTP